MESDAVIRDLQHTVDRLREELDRLRHEYTHLLTLVAQGEQQDDMASVHAPVSVDAVIPPGVHTHMCTDRADRSTGLEPEVTEVTDRGARRTRRMSS